VRTPASGVDVAPTLMALAGAPPSTQMIGINLIEPRDPGRLVLVEHGDHPRVERTQVALYDGQFKLVRHGVAAPFRYALHDLESDPEGLVDSSSLDPQRVERMSAALELYRSRWRPVELAVDAPGGDDVRALRTLGYLDSAIDAPPVR
jgi:arylsulfatase A-like enzyme